MGVLISNTTFGSSHSLGVDFAIQPEGTVLVFNLLTGRAVQCSGTF